MTAEHGQFIPEETKENPLIAFEFPGGLLEAFANMPFWTVANPLKFIRALVEGEISLGEVSMSMLGPDDIVKLDNGAIVQIINSEELSDTSSRVIVVPTLPSYKSSKLK